MLIVASILAMPLQAKDKESLYVLPTKAPMTQDPRMQSPRLTQLPRGTQVVVIEDKEDWVRIEHEKKMGWILKVHLTSQKPIGAPETDEKIADTLEKSTRKRTAGYPTSAATRGVTGKGEDGSADTVDRAAVEELEAVKIPATEVEQFRAKGNLTTEPNNDAAK